MIREGRDGIECNLMTSVFVTETITENVTLSSIILDIF